MEGVNMPAHPKVAWRWIVGTTAAATLLISALPSVGQASGVTGTELTFCVSSSGLIRGVNVECNSGQTQVGPFETVGPQGEQGPDGVQGPPGLQGPQGAAGGPGGQGPQGAQGPVGPTGNSGAAGIAGVTGPQGIQGNPGIQGIQGIPGNQGAPGTNGNPGGNQTNKTFLTGGTLGTFGLNEEIALSGANVEFDLDMGPGNGAAQDNTSVEVPMNDPGTAYNLFVNVDNNPGTDITGQPASYGFVLCNNLSPCNVACVITDPDTTCADLQNTTGDFITYNPGDLMLLLGFSNTIFANTADVKWSVTYDHVSFPFGTP
jgi:hypothetical protein